VIFIYSISYFELENYKQKGAILIDLRSYNDFLSYHIPSSIPIHSLKVLPRGKPIVFICEHGHNARQMAFYYRNYYYECYFLEGGIQLYLEMNKKQPYF